MSGEASDKIELILVTTEIWLNYGGLFDVYFAIVKFESKKHETSVSTSRKLDIA